MAIQPSNSDFLANCLLRGLDPSSSPHPCSIQFDKKWTIANATNDEHKLFIHLPGIIEERIHLLGNAKIPGIALLARKLDRTCIYFENRNQEYDFSLLTEAKFVHEVLILTFNEQLPFINDKECRVYIPSVLEEACLNLTGERASIFKEDSHFLLRPRFLLDMEKPILDFCLLDAELRDVRIIENVKQPGVAVYGKGSSTEITYLAKGKIFNFDRIERWRFTTDVSNTLRIYFRKPKPNSTLESAPPLPEERALPF